MGVGDVGDCFWVLRHFQIIGWTRGQMFRCGTNCGGVADGLSWRGRTSEDTFVDVVICFAATKEGNSVVTAAPSLRPSAEWYGLWPDLDVRAKARTYLRSKNKSKSRFPAGMTARKAKAATVAR